MRKNSPTLADALIQASFKKHYELLDPKRELPKLLAEANRYVLNDSMSGFMADLAWASLLTSLNQGKAQNLLDSMRRQARAPHKVTWIEYNHQAKHRRSQEYGSNRNSPADSGPDKCGWLILQHPQIDTAFWAIECASHSWDLDGKTKIANPQAFAFSHVWCSEDHPIPWNRFPLKVHGGTVEGITTGVLAYRSPYVGVSAGFVPEKIALKFIQHSESRGQSPVKELAGDLRYLWALLTTLNDLPVKISEATAAPGHFFAKGKYRKFLTHKTITLTIPETKYKRTAARAIVAVRKRAHQVRGHHRVHWKHPGRFDCEHEYRSMGQEDRSVVETSGTVLECKFCGQRKSWITEHVRGDASLGFVTHSYEVHRGDDPHDGQQ
jgi:hypothetical protein